MAIAVVKHLPCIQEVLGLNLGATGHSPVFLMDFSPGLVLGYLWGFSSQKKVLQGFLVVVSEHPLPNYRWPCFRTCTMAVGGRPELLLLVK